MSLRRLLLVIGRSPPSGPPSRLLRAPELLAAALVAISCGTTEDPGGPRDGGGAPDALPAGAPVIRAFTAATSEVQAYQSVELSWEVEGARLVDISGPGGTLISTFDGEGTVASGPLREDSSFTLTARNGAEVVSATVQVEVEWRAPVITSFAASPSPALIGSFVSLQWFAVDAERSRVLVEGVELGVSPLPPEGGQGFLNALIEQELTIFVLEVSNPEQTTTAELVVAAGRPPEIRRFRVSPRVMMSRTVTATISWEVVGVARTQLFVSGAERFDFPGTPSGMMNLELRGPADFRLVAGNEVSFAEAYAVVSPPTGEVEPNDTFAEAYDLTFPGGVQGSFSWPGDQDVFSVFVSEGASLRVITSGQIGTGCDVDTGLVLYDASLVELGRTSGGGDDGGGGACAVIDPATDVFASRLLGGLHFLVLTSEGGEVGSYGIATEEL